MKHIKINLALAALAGSMALASCSSDEIAPTIGGEESAVSTRGIAPAKASDITFYAGGNQLVSTLTSRAGNGSFSYHKYWDGDFPAQYKDNRPGDIQQDEKTFVIKYIKEHKDQNSVPFNYSNYFIQNIGSSKDNYTGLVDQNNAQHQVVGGQHMDYLVINGQHINDYNATQGPNALVMNLLVKNPTYHDSWGDKDQTKENAYKIYEITYNGKKGYYLAFDYRTKKNSGEVHDGDGVYNDWVVKLTPADPIDQENTGTTPPPSSENPNPQVPQEPTPTPPVPSIPEVTPSTPIVTTTKGEIEVNLSLNKKKTDGDWIASKLSIHVRANSDVEVFLPVDAQYYCEQDDMNIVLSHKHDDLLYNNTTNKEMTWQVAGQTVKLTVSYEANGIRVKTQGINETVLKELREKYGDGITFEVWNYFKSEAITREQLQPMLNNSTIKFTAVPDRYVNAFGAVYNYNDGESPVYSKLENAGTDNEVWTPYTDENLTQPLDQQYWEREAGEKKYYLLKHHMNPLDCTVTPEGTELKESGKRVYSKLYTK